MSNGETITFDSVRIRNFKVLKAMKLNGGTFTLLDDLYIPEVEMTIPAGTECSPVSPMMGRACPVWDRPDIDFPVAGMTVGV